jgi:tetratricopeptide (TPR) repeat protein
VPEPHLTRRQREDPLVMTWVRTQEWMEANARLLAVVAGAVLLVIVVTVLWVRARAEAEGKAGEKVAEISALYWQGGYDRVIQGVDQLRKDYPGTAAAKEAIRVKGDALFWQGDFKGARAAYQAYLTEDTKPSPVRLGVRRNLAQALESERQFKEAAALYEELAREPGPRAIQAELLLAAGEDWRSAGDSARAAQAFGRVARDYADTPSGAKGQMYLGEVQLRDP